MSIRPSNQAVLIALVQALTGKVCTIGNDYVVCISVESRDRRGGQEHRTSGRQGTARHFWALGGPQRIARLPSTSETMGEALDVAGCEASIPSQAARLVAVWLRRVLEEKLHRRQALHSGWWLHILGGA